MDWYLAHSWKTGKQLEQVTEGTGSQWDSAGLTWQLDREACSHRPGVHGAEGDWTRVPERSFCWSASRGGDVPPHLSITESRTRGQWQQAAEGPLRSPGWERTVLQRVPEEPSRCPTGKTTGICNLPQPGEHCTSSPVPAQEDQALIPYFLSCSLSSPSQPKPARTTISI